jgi:hypothetical protein
MAASSGLFERTGSISVVICFFSLLALVFLIYSSKPFGLTNWHEPIGMNRLDFNRLVKKLRKPWIFLL